MALARIAAVIGAALCIASAVNAQPSPADIARAHNATVGIVAGEADSTAAWAAEDLARALNDGEKLRIRPMQGSGAEQDIADLVFAKGVDLAIVHADSLRRELQDSAVRRESSIRTVAKLYESEVHVLARGTVTRLADLSGQPVDADPDAAVTARAVFAASGVAVSLQVRDSRTGIARLLAGQTAAVVVVGGKPVPLLQALPAGRDLHFLRVPLTAALVDLYVPTQLEHLQYPALVPDGQPVPTVAVGAVMLTLAAPPGSPRAQRVDRFVDALFAHFPRLLGPGFHPKWREVSLTARVQGIPPYSRVTTLSASTRVSASP